MKHGGKIITTYVVFAIFTAAWTWDLPGWDMSSKEGRENHIFLSMLSGVFWPAYLSVKGALVVVRGLKAIPKSCG